MPPQPPVENIPMAIPQRAIPVNAQPPAHVMPIGYRTAKTDYKNMNSREDFQRDFIWPTVLLVVGLSIDMGFVFWRSPQRAQLEGWLILVGVAIDTVLMLAAVFAVAYFNGMKLGKFHTAVLKLAAISIAPSAITDVLNLALRFIPFGFLISWICDFILYFTFIGLLFDLDQSDTWACVWSIFITRIIAYFVVIYAVVKFLP